MDYTNCIRTEDGFCGIEWKENSVTTVGLFFSLSLLSSLFFSLFLLLSFLSSLFFSSFLSLSGRR